MENTNDNKEDHKSINQLDALRSIVDVVIVEVLDYLVPLNFALNFVLGDSHGLGLRLRRN